MRTVLVLVALAILAAFAVDNGPRCWEDETRVVVVQSAYLDSRGVIEPGSVECVPVDDLTAGYRP